MLPAQDLYGALSLVCSDPAWALLRRNIVPVAGDDPTVRNRPVYPISVQPQSDDSPAVRQVWKHQKSQFDAAALAESQIVIFLLDSVGPTNLLHLEEGGTDLLDLTAREICESMTLAHGILTMSDLVTLRKPLSEPLSNAANFLAHANQARLVHVRLTEESAPYLQLDQYRLFKETLHSLTVQTLLTVRHTVRYPKSTSHPKIPR